MFGLARTMKLALVFPVAVEAGKVDVNVISTQDFKALAVGAFSAANAAKAFAFLAGCPAPEIVSPEGGAMLYRSLIA